MGAVGPVDVADRFARFADAHAHLPLYGRIAREAAADPEVVALLDAARPGQARPVLLLAALHDLVLRTPSVPAARWFAAAPDLDGDPWPDVRATLLDHAPSLRSVVAARSTQTNEVNRAVYVAALLRAAARDVPDAPAALVELGASAGLLLGLDRYALHLGPDLLLGDPTSPVVCTTSLRPAASAAAGSAGSAAAAGSLPGASAGAAAGPLPGASAGSAAAASLPCASAGSAAAGSLPGASAGSAAGAGPLTDHGWPGSLAGVGLPAIVERVGVDRTPVDLADADEVRWLEACLWPDQPDRLARFRAAVAHLRSDPPLVVAGDMLTDLPSVAHAARAVATATAPGADVHLVVLTSWALTYVRRDQRPLVAEALADLAADGRPVSWISAEPPGAVPGIDVPPALADAAAEQTALGLRRWRAGVEQPPALVGLSHPHATWLHLL